MNITISVNNTCIELPPETSLKAYLDQYKADPDAQFAVALNGEFVPKSRYAGTHLNNGDEVDIVSPVGGG